MKLLKNVLMLFLIHGFLGCASVHPGQEAHSIDQTASKIPIRMSALNVLKPTGESFQLVEITIENLSGEWIKITNASVVINNPAESKISVVLGRDLKDWAQAMMYRENIEAQNHEMIQMGLLIAGAAAIIGGKSNTGLVTAGAGAYATGATWALYDAVQYSLRYAEGVQTTPENYLYQPFSVPGKMFLRRWVLINKPLNLQVDKLVLELETIDGTKDHYVVAL